MTRIQKIIVIISIGLILCSIFLGIRILQMNHTHQKILKYEQKLTQDIQLNNYQNAESLSER